MSLLRLFAPIFLSAAVAACAAGDQLAPCQTGGDCSSGICNADGTCAVDETATSSTTGTGSSSSGPSSSSGGEGGSGAGGGGGGSGGANVCSPNADGTITADEVPLGPGLHATFRAAENVTVDTAGTTSGGTRTWDFSTALDGDHGELVETQDPSGQWYGSDFAGATYAARLSDTATLLGVFQVTGDALLLLGVVSPTDAAPSTELTYDPPVTVLKFPLTQGASWTTTSNVTGTAMSTPVFYTEQYDAKVDAAGTVKTPFGPFDVLRVRTDLTRTVGFSVTISHQFAFVAECFGTIATVNSQLEETSDEFTNAAEIARLAP